MADLYVVGLGPGDPSFLTAAARSALDRAEVIIGYTVYVDLIAPEYPDKEFIATPMRTETERCRMAIETAASGRTAALVCSGDAGVYGMAAPVLELLAEYNGQNEGSKDNEDNKDSKDSKDSKEEVTVEIVPGITAALSGAAVLGAPLGHDFCVISLSDLLTPWEVIERRLAAAAAGDFAVCLYNPASRKRTDHLRRACEILLGTKTPETACGIVRNIGRPGEAKKLLTLEELRDETVDMFTTVFIGSSRTKFIGGRLVTPRGYEIEEAAYRESLQQEVLP